MDGFLEKFFPSIANNNSNKVEVRGSLLMQKDLRRIYLACAPSGANRTEKNMNSTIIGGFLLQEPTEYAIKGLREKLGDATLTSGFYCRKETYTANSIGGL